VDPLPATTQAYDPFTWRWAGTPYPAKVYPDAATTNVNVADFTRLRQWEEPPADARYIGASGSNTNAGTSAAPWKTIPHAVANTPVSATTGKKEIVFLDPFYRHEQLFAANDQMGEQLGEAVHFRGAPGVPVEISGAKQIQAAGQSVFTQQADNLYKWDGVYTHDYHHTTPTFDDANLTADERVLCRSGYMVFVDGRLLVEKNQRTQVLPGAYTYVVDVANGGLYLGINPNTQRVEVSWAQRLFHFRGSASNNCRVSGITVWGYASALKLAPMRGDNAKNVEYRWCHTFLNAGVGQSIAANIGGVGNVDDAGGGKMFWCASTHNGQSGFHGDNVHDMLRLHCVRAYNNRYKPVPSGFEAGDKTSRSDNTTEAWGFSEQNFANGFWRDEGCERAVYIFCTSQKNSRSGFAWEIGRYGVGISLVSDENDYNVKGNEEEDLFLAFLTLVNGYLQFQLRESARAEIHNNVREIIRNLQYHATLVLGYKAGTHAAEGAVNTNPRSVKFQDDSANADDVTIWDITAQNGASHNHYWRENTSSPTTFLETTLAAGAGSASFSSFAGWKGDSRTVNRGLDQVGSTGTTSATTTLVEDLANKRYRSTAPTGYVLPATVMSLLRSRLSWIADRIPANVDLVDVPAGAFHLGPQYAIEDFQDRRTNPVGNWGTSIRGGDWTHTPTSGTDYKMTNGAGQHIVPAGASQRNSRLDSTPLVDFDLVWEWETDELADIRPIFQQVLARYQGITTTGAHYRIFTRCDTNRAMTLGVNYHNGTGEVGVGSPVALSLIHSAHRRYVGRLQFQGNIIRHKAWYWGDDEPLNWMATWTTGGEITTAGGIGLRTSIVMDATRTKTITTTFQYLAVATL